MKAEAHDLDDSRTTKPMMFLASKLLSFATQPIAWVLILLGLGLWLLPKQRAWGMRLGWAAFIVLFLVGWQLPVEAVLRRLETRYPVPDPSASLAGYAGMVVLGGALERAELWQRPGQVALNASAERMIAPIGLLKRNPDLRIIFTGGEGNLMLADLSESDRAKRFFDSVGIDPARVTYESRSRTTFDNAVFTAELPGVDQRAKWLLLTTCAHMPRSMGSFLKAGWNVTAFCVDYRAPEHASWSDVTDYSFTKGVEKWHYALHETIGYAAYWLAGRI